MPPIFSQKDDKLLCTLAGNAFTARIAVFSVAALLNNRERGIIEHRCLEALGSNADAWTLTQP